MASDEDGGLTTFLSDGLSTSFQIPNSLISFWMWKALKIGMMDMA